jgi:tetratricopeptide (TPR) repeat protein
MSVRSILAGLLALTLATGRAEAADRRAEATAREHLQRGMRLYDLGRFDEAIKEFEAAYQYQDGPVYLFNLAQAHRRAGNDAKALELYRTYLRKAPDAPDRDQIERRIAALEKALADVGHRVDSLERASPPVEAPAPARRAPPPVLVTAAPAARPHQASGLAVAGLVTTVAGLAAVATGAVLAVRVKHQSDEAAQAPVFDPALDESARRTQRFESLFLGLGGAAVVTGGTLMVLGLRSTQGTALAPRIDRRGVQLALIGRF